MQVKNRFSFLLCCMFIIQLYQSGHCVTPPRSSFNFIFENTFEDDQVGDYTLNDYNQDWFSPEWNHRRDVCDIVQDTNPRYSKYMRGYFPDGIFSVDNSGFGWQSPLQESVTEMYFSYDLRFKPGFQWVLGGKIPGMIGGDLHTSPTGGLAEGDGFSTRPMWKQDGRIVMYIYHHDMPGQYGDTYNWDLVNNTAFYFQSGQWYNVTLRVVLNSINPNTHLGNNDGILEGYIDGVLRYQRTNYRFRNSESIDFDYFYVTAFFGGGTQDWAATRDEWMDTDNYVAFTYDDALENVPHGFDASVRTKKLVHPYLNFDDSAWKSSLHVNSAQAHQISISWNDYSFPTEYKVERRLANSSIFTQIASLSENDTIYTDLGLTNATEYVYRIIAGNSISNELTVSTLIGENIPENHTPSAQNQSFLVLHDTFDGLIGSMVATDPDAGQTIQFSITEGNNDLLFSIDEESGEITTPNPTDLSFEESKEYQLSIQIQDNAPVMKDTIVIATISIVGMPVVDIDSNSTPVTYDQVFVVNNENFNGSIGQFIATDPDEGQMLTYSISAGNEANLFLIDSLSGNIEVISEESINFSESKEYSLTINVCDNAPSCKDTTSKAFISIRGENKISVIYIDPLNISDPLADGSISHPFQTWQDINWADGMTYLQKRNTIAISPKIIVQANNVTLGSYGEGERAEISSSATDYAIKVFEKTGITVKDLHINAVNAVGSIYILGTTSDENEINNCILESSEYGIRIVDGKKATIRYNTFLRCKEAVYSFATENLLYYNIFNSNLNAINIASNDATAEIYNNVFYNNQNGVSVSYADLSLFNNIFYLSNPGDVALNHQLDKLVSDNNIFYPEQEGFISIANTSYSTIRNYQQETYLDLNSFSKDPIFVDVYNNNFALNENSPAIDNGKSIGLHKDFFGASVPYGVAPDIGLIESEIEGPVIDPTAINKSSEILTDFTIYPNPTNGIFDITFENNASYVKTLYITNMSGGRVFLKEYGENERNYTQRINVSSLPKGLYMIFFEVDYKIVSQKLIIT